MRLFKKTLTEHFDVVNRKDQQIALFETSSNQLRSDLYKSNDLAYLKQNQILSLQDQLNCVKHSNKFPYSPVFEIFFYSEINTKQLFRA